MHHDALRNHEYRLQALRAEAEQERLARSLHRKPPNHRIVYQLRVMAWFFINIWKPRIA